MTTPRIAVNGMLLRHPYTGVEYSILNLVRALAEHGSAAYDAYVPYDFDGDAIAGANLNLIRGGPPMPARAMRILWEQVCLPVRVASSGANCLHAPGYIAPLRCRIPVVLTIYDVIALQHPEWCKPSNHLHYRRFLPASARMAARIVVPSESTRRDVRDRLNVPNDKIATIPLGIDPRYRVMGEDEKQRERQRLNLPESFILFVGQLEPKKNLPLLLDAFRELKAKSSIPHRLVIAGTRGWKTGALEHRVHEDGLEGEVHLLGYVPEYDLPAIYNLADLFVFPSLYEGFGLPPLEAMACGTPVVASTAGALPEVAGDVATLVDPRDASALARAIEVDLEPGAGYDDRVEAGRAHAAKYTWQAYAAAIDRVYHAACNGSS